MRKRQLYYRSQQQFSKFQELAFLMPRAEMAVRLPDGAEQALAISRDCSEIRYRVASQPALARCLMQHGLHGRDYIEAVQSEKDELLLLLPERSR